MTWCSVSPEPIAVENGRRALDRVADYEFPRSALFLFAFKVEENRADRECVGETMSYLSNEDAMGASAGCTIVRPPRDGILAGDRLRQQGGSDLRSRYLGADWG